MAEHEAALDIIATVLPLVVGIALAIAGGVNAAGYVIFKRVILNIHNLVKAVKEAFDDDQLTPEETREIIELLLKLIRNDPEAAKTLLNNYNTGGATPKK